MEIHWTTPNTDLGGTGFFPGRLISTTQRDEFLAQRGWHIGDRLPHSDCPIDPAHVSHSPNPVAILDRGLYCHSCAGRSGNGMRSYSSLITGAATATSNAGIAEAAKRGVPLAHVAIVMRSTLPLFAR